MHSFPSGPSQENVKMSFSAVTLVAVTNKSMRIALKTLNSEKKVFTATVPRNLRNVIFALPLTNF